MENAQPKLQLLEYHPLDAMNTFGLQAKARYFVAVEDVGELKEALSLAQENAWPLFILGGGSNILLCGDFNGLVIKVGILGFEVVNENEDLVTVRVGAGESWHPVVMRAIAQGWGGIENMALIPGCIGAAPIQNIGAYGVEIKDVFAFLDAHPVAGGPTMRFDAAACRFGYRDSMFKGEWKGQYVITHVALTLRKRDHRIDISYGAIADELRTLGIDPQTAGIADVAQAVINIRQSKLPDPKVIGNAGSFFKNPEVPKPQFDALKALYPSLPGYVVSDTVMKIPAGWLIEQAGWKGKRLGDHGVHDKQALVLVNHGQAKGSDLLALSQAIMDSVREKYGVMLEREVNVV